MGELSRESVLSQVCGVLEDVLDQDGLLISDNTTAAEIEGWDSLTHIRLMVTVEAAFGIKFSTAEVAGLESVGQLVDLILKKS